MTLPSLKLLSNVLKGLSNKRLSESAGELILGINLLNGEQGRLDRPKPMPFRVEIAGAVGEPVCGCKL